MKLSYLFMISILLIAEEACSIRPSSQRAVFFQSEIRELGELPMYVNVKKIEIEEKTVEMQGRVLSETRSPFENVSIYSKSESKIGSTNGDGSFTIKIGKEDTIAFKFPTYQTLYMTLIPKK